MSPTSSDRTADAVIARRPQAAVAIQRVVPPVAALLAVILVALAVLATGCAQTPLKRDPEFAPAEPIQPPPMPEGDGAIYHAGYARSWVESARARNVGDLLTVRLAERTDAEKRSKSSVNKTNSQEIKLPVWAGQTYPKSAIGQPLVGLDSSTDFEGEGDAAQGNKLTGEVTVTVVQVLTNGNMAVRGEKRLGINQGNEYIRIAGIVRPEDVDPLNVVMSTKVADATFQYVGEGQVNDAAVMGWLSRFFISALWPF
jgi:flagellar L-ring protein precursor FlgH